MDGLRSTKYKVLADHVSGATLPTRANRKLLGILSKMNLSITQYESRAQAGGKIVNKSIYFISACADTKNRVTSTQIEAFSNYMRIAAWLLH